MNQPIPRRRRTGFTLVEILIVVVILGILGAIVVPQFLSAAGESRDNSMRMSIHRMRIQIELYRTQHNDEVPELASFVDQMTLASNALGETAAPGTAGYDFGPYVNKIPVNPYTGTNDVTDGAIGTSAWYYNEASGVFKANDSVESNAF